MDEALYIARLTVLLDREISSRAALAHRREDVLSAQRDLLDKERALEEQDRKTESELVAIDQERLEADLLRRRDHGLHSQTPLATPSVSRQKWQTPVQTSDDRCTSLAVEETPSRRPSADSAGHHDLHLQTPPSTIPLTRQRLEASGQTLSSRPSPCAIGETLSEKIPARSAHSHSPFDNPRNGQRILVDKLPFCDGSIGSTDHDALKSLIAQADIDVEDVRVELPSCIVCRPIDNTWVELRCQECGCNASDKIFFQGEQGFRRHVQVAHGATFDAEWILGYCHHRTFATAEVLAMIRGDADAPRVECRSTPILNAIDIEKGALNYEDDSLLENVNYEDSDVSHTGSFGRCPTRPVEATSTSNKRRRDGTSVDLSSQKTADGYKVTYPSKKSCSQTQTSLTTRKVIEICDTDDDEQLLGPGLSNSRKQAPSTPSKRARSCPKTPKTPKAPKKRKMPKKQKMPKMPKLPKFKKPFALTQEE